MCSSVGATDSSLSQGLQKSFHVGAKKAEERVLDLKT